MTTDLVYVRLHGPGGKYQGRYSDEVLDEWGRRIRDWAGSGCAVYIYFDKDDSGFAAFNAAELRRRVHPA